MNSKYFSCTLEKILQKKLNFQFQLKLISSVLVAQSTPETKAVLKSWGGSDYPDSSIQVTIVIDECNQANEVNGVNYYNFLKVSR